MQRIKCFFVQPNLRILTNSESILVCINTARKQRHHKINGKSIRWVNISQQYFLFHWFHWVLKKNFIERMREIYKWIWFRKKIQTGKEIFTIEDIYRQSELLNALDSLANICWFRIRRMPKTTATTPTTITTVTCNFAHGKQWRRKKKIIIWAM